MTNNMTPEEMDAKRAAWWLKARVRERVFAVMDEGEDRIKEEVHAVVQEAVRLGLLALPEFRVVRDGDHFTIFCDEPGDEQFLIVPEAPAMDRLLRVHPPVVWQGTLT